jgi:hypothetical protein
MRDKLIVEAMNHWLDRYINHPERFERQFQMIRDFEGREHPDYGARCLAYMKQISAEVNPPVKRRKHGRGNDRRAAHSGQSRSRKS